MLALDCNMHTVAEKWDPPFLYPQRLRILSIRKSFYTKSARHDDSSYRDTRGSTARSPAKHKPARLHASTINTPDRKRCHSGHHICPSQGDSRRTTNSPRRRRRRRSACRRGRRRRNSRKSFGRPEALQVLGADRNSIVWGSVRISTPSIGRCTCSFHQHNGHVVHNQSNHKGRPQFHT